MTPEGNRCTYSSAVFSTDLSYYALICNGPDPAVTKIYKTEPETLLSVWQENASLRTKLQQYTLPKIKIFQVLIPGTEFKAAVKVIFPPEIDLDNLSANTKKYPLLVRVYGGPGSVRVANSYSVAYQVRHT